MAAATAATVAAAALAFGAVGAAAAPSGTPSPEGPANLWAVSWWPGDAAEHTMWVDDVDERVWGLPGGTAYVWFDRDLLNGPDPCEGLWDPDPDAGDDDGPIVCDRGGWEPIYDYEVPPADTTQLELEDGTVVGELVPYNKVFKVTAPLTNYTGNLYASYLDVDDEDGDGNTSERLHRVAASMVVKPIRTQPAVTSPTENIDITAMVDVSGSMDTNDPDFKRRDAVDLLFRTAVPGDRIGVSAFSHVADELQPVTEVSDDEHAKTLSASVRPLITNGGGTDYQAGLDKGFRQLYSDAVAEGTLSSRRKLGVFLTDGKQEHYNSRVWEQYLNTHVRFTHSPGQYSWPVCVIQLGNSFSSRAVNRLKRIARDSGGAYMRATTDASLVDAFKACRGVSACEFTVHRRSWGSVSKDQELATRARVPAGRRLASFLVTGDNIRHAVSLVGPSGTRYTPGSLPEGIRYKTGRSWSMFEVDGPGRGDWRVEITATGVAEGTTDRVITRASVDQCGTTAEIPNED